MTLEKNYIKREVLKKYIKILFNHDSSEVVNPACGKKKKKKTVFYETCSCIFHRSLLEPQMFGVTNSFIANSFYIDFTCDSMCPFSVIFMSLQI